jgi:hypothetical protein
MSVRKKGMPVGPSHASILELGVKQWNSWRELNPHTTPNLYESTFHGADLSGANLSGADLRGSHFAEADLRSAHLDRADLYRATVWRANLSDATLVAADLSSTNLNGAILTRADLRDTNLRFSRLAGVEVSGARFTGCSVYGSSIWNLKGSPGEQLDITITPLSEPTVTVDNIEVAQFIYLLLKNEKVRYVIDTITSKVVLILGRFTPERKEVLDAIRTSLRTRGYVPIMFDFEKPRSRNLTETVSTLAHMARFVVADITGARSIPQELQAIVPNLPNVPVQPILLKPELEYGMFDDFRSYPWVLEEFLYADRSDLLANLETKIILPPERRILTQKR